jgi:hypothetical protein
MLRSGGSSDWLARLSSSILSLPGLVFVTQRVQLHNINIEGEKESGKMKN